MYPTRLWALAALALAACQDQGLQTFNADPVATITFPVDGDERQAGEAVDLHGVVSDSDHDQLDLLARWTANGEEICAEQAPSAQGDSSCEASLEAGAVTLTLEVRDPKGAVGVDSVDITVLAANNDPSCAITAPESGSTGEEGESITFEATASDPDVDPTQLSATWTSDQDGELATSTPSAQGTITFTTSGLNVASHVVTLEVQDEQGASCTDQVTYVVGTPPSVSITSPSSGDVVDEGAMVTFEAQVSDSEEPASGLALSWSSSLDGELSDAGADSSGLATFATADLFNGDHAVTLTVTDAEGLWAQDLVSVVVNGLPSAPEVSLSPDPAYTSDDLEVSIDTASEDPDDDTVSYGYAWSVDGASSSASTSATLPSSATTKHEVWQVAVTPTDGTSSGEAVTASLTIDNSPPVLASASLTPDPAGEDDTLVCTPGSTSDADGDSVSTSVSWDVSGTTHTGLGSSLDGTYFERGDVVSCEVTPNDGEEDGAAVVSNDVTIENTAPSITTVTLSPDPAYAGDTLTCSYAGFYDADDDSDLSTIAWTLDGVSAGSGTTYSSGQVHGDVLACTVTPSDGTDNGTAVSATITVSNTAPSITAVTLGPDPATAADTLTCSYTGYSDADGDADASSYAWTIDGVSAGSGSTIASGFSRGDTVRCTVTPWDGYDGGTTAYAELVIDNTPPEVSSVSVAPTTVYTDSTLAASVSLYDANGDAVSSSYAWYVDGTFVYGGGASLDGATYFDKDHQVYVTVTPSDGTDSGSSLSSSTLTVLNSPPGEPTVSILPAAPEEGADDLVCSVDTASSDADGDSVDYGFAWTVDGVAYPGGWDTGDTGAGWTGPDTTTWTDDTVPGGDTLEGETWTCTVTPDDGDDTGTAASASVTIEAGEEEETSYTDTWSMDRSASYSCAYGLVNISFSTLVIADAYPTIVVTAGSGSQPGSMSGSFSSTTAFTASNYLPGSCAETYTITGTFIDANTLGATFEASYSGGVMCLGCSYYSTTFTATR